MFNLVNSRKSEYQKLLEEREKIAEKQQRMSDPKFYRRQELIAVLVFAAGIFGCLIFAGITAAGMFN